MISRVKRLSAALGVLGVLVGLGFATTGLSTHTTFLLLAAVLLPVAALAAYFLSPAIPRGPEREQPKQPKPHYVPKPDDDIAWEPHGVMTHAHSQG